MRLRAPGMCLADTRWTLRWRTGPGLLLLLCLGGMVRAQVRYSVLEELEEGAQVGNVASALRLEVGSLKSRRFRLSSDTKIQYFDINLDSGIVFVKRKIDREALCGASSKCLINLEAVMDSPLELHRVQVEIVDVNDNAPVFPVKERHMSISEATLSGAHFPLEGAIDPDVGTNSVSAYKLSPNEFFVLEAPVAQGKSSSVEMVLTKILDREQQSEIRLTLTAVDGGIQSRSGSTNIIIAIEDVNDNRPVFDKAVYSVRLLENAPVGALVIQLNATDADEGQNGAIYYSFSDFASHEIKQLFSINKENGEIRIIGPIDFEEKSTFEIRVQVQDRGLPVLTGHCKVQVDIIDLNDNAPEIRVTSLSSPVMEDATIGLVIALFTVTDRDSGVNGQVHCEVPPGLPFIVESKYESYYSLVLRKSLDREVVSEYNVAILAKDGGTPSLSTIQTIVVVVADVNDNPPRFLQTSYTAICLENNVPGSSIFQVSATDPDFKENSQIRYSLLGTSVDGISVSNLVSVHPDTGHIFALQPFDYEKTQVVEFCVEARDSGSPSLKSSANVTLFIGDQNDNSPTILSDKGSSSVIFVPRLANSGHLVSKIRAVDADSGYNAWLSFILKEPSKRTPFGIGLHTGEVRTTRTFADSEGDDHSLVFLVMDNGKPPLSATATLVISLAESKQEAISDQKHVTKSDNAPADLNLYLIISIASILSFFLLSVMLFIASRFLRSRRYNADSGKPDLGSAVGLNCSYPPRQQNLFYATVESLEANHNSQNSHQDNQGWTNNELSDGTSSDLLQNLLGTDPVVMVQSEPKNPNTDWRYSSSLRAGVQSAVHLEESAILRGVQQVLETQWPTVSSTNTDPDGGEVSPPVGAGVNCNSWTFKYGPVNPKQPAPAIPPDFPENFIIPGSPAIISIRQDQPSAQAAEKGNFITFGKKEEAKKKKKKKKGIKSSDKKEKGNSATDNSDQ